jgi:glutamine synthetase
MSLEADWFLRAHPEITTIEALLPDCNGVMRGKWLPRHKLGKIFDGELKLPKTALSLDIWGRDVEELVFASGDADGICRPVEGSLLPTPWSPQAQHGQVMLSMFDADGTPYMGDPRHVLKQVVTRYQEAGWRPVVAAELEFSLVRWDETIPHRTGVQPGALGRNHPPSHLPLPGGRLPRWRQHLRSRRAQPPPGHDGGPAPGL